MLWKILATLATVCAVATLVLGLTAIWTVGQTQGRMENTAIVTFFLCLGFGAASAALATIEAEDEILAAEFDGGCE